MDPRNIGTVGDYVPYNAPRFGDSYHGPISGSIVGGEGSVNVVYNLGNADPLLEYLEHQIVKDALYNSQNREEEHTSTCRPDTFTRIVRRLEEWTRPRSTEKRGRKYYEDIEPLRPLRNE